MRYTIPHYYREFSCAADRCTDTCCAGWEIMIDPASLKKYRKTKGPLGNRLHNSIRWDQGSFKQYGRRCAFLADSGLCDLYSDLPAPHRGVRGGQGDFPLHLLYRGGADCAGTAGARAFPGF